MKKLFVIFLSLLGLSLLSGCIATTNLLMQRGALPDDLHSIAVQMVNVAKRTCIRTSGPENQSKDDWQKGRKLDTDDWIISRFYVSDAGWYKASAITQGVIDDLFYNKNTKQLVCGSHLWSKYSNSGLVKFVEYGTSEMLLKDVPVKYSSITEFRKTGLSQLKYDSDAKLCEDVKFAIQFYLTKDTKMDPTGFRLLRVSELTEELSKYSKKEAVYLECGEKYFGNK